MKRTLTILIMVLGLASCKKEELSQSEVPPQVRLTPIKGKLVLMHYIPWYETPEFRGRWGSHWTGHDQQHDPSQTDESGLPDIWSHYHPLIGLYDSTDEDVIECQLLQMKLAGIDGVIVDWYGLETVADYPQIHEATQKIFEVSQRVGMRFSVCFEDRTLEYQVKTNKLAHDQVGAQLTETIQWLSENWFSSPHYVRLDGKPLVLNFGPIFCKEPTMWHQALASVEDRPAFFALHHLWKDIGADGGFTWAHANAWSSDEQIKERLVQTYQRIGSDPKKIIVSALPGFKDVYQHSHPVIAHRDGLTMRESLQVCLNGPWEVVQLVTWNDYGEGTMIEPTHEFGYRFLEIIQEERRDERGITTGKSEDLRLPAQLLELRRKGTLGKEELDLIAQHLAGGSLNKARQLLEQYATSPSKLQ